MSDLDTPQHEPSRRPRRTSSLKELAARITDSVIDRFEKTLAENVSDKVYRRDAARLKMHEWIESVSLIPIDVLDRAVAADKWVRVAYDDRDYPPTDLRIVKEYRNSAAASTLVDAHDRRKCNIPFEKLFDQSLFPELDYADIRDRALVLGENHRVHIKDAGPDHYKLHDDIEKANFDAQKNARREYLKSQRSRKRLFALHPDCKTTDQLMRKLGVKWKK